MKNEAQLESYSQPSLSCQVNGEPVTLAVPASKRLLSIIRDDLELPARRDHARSVAAALAWCFWMAGRLMPV